MAILNITNLSFKYYNNNNYAIKDLSFSVQEGEFVIISGVSGCGKTTLLRLMKKEISPLGESIGHIEINNQDINKITLRESTKLIGYVMQNPENAIVTDKVWHELAFGLENIGYESEEIKRRVYEIANYFGLEDIFEKETSKLSGGEKQLVNLASIMILNPKILLLDEPTSQLDPNSSSRFIDIIKKINLEFGTTIILVEHRLDEVIHFANKILILREGKSIFFDDPHNINELLRLDSNTMECLPMIIKLYQSVNTKLKCPLSINEGRTFIKTIFNKPEDINIDNKLIYNEKVLELKNIYFRYEKKSKDSIKGLNLEIHKGLIYSIVGGNGAGKTTLLKIMARLYKPYTGKVYLNGIDINKYNEKDLYINNIGYLTQNPQDMFMSLTVNDELNDICKNVSYINNNLLNRLINTLKLEDCLDKNPYDLSGGQQQRVALCKVLLLEPKVLLLDEPTKGLDAISKKELKQLLFLLKKNITIILVTHDLDFVGEVSDLCTMLFNGELTKTMSTRDFFQDNQIYLTTTNRLTKNILSNCQNYDDVIEMYNKVGIKNEYKKNN